MQRNRNFPVKRSLSHLFHVEHCLVFKDFFSLDCKVFSIGRLLLVRIGDTGSMGDVKLKGLKESQWQPVTGHIFKLSTDNVQQLLCITLLSDSEPSS